MSELIFPPYLQKKDKIVIISPSGKIDKKLLTGAQKRLSDWGFDASLSKHAAKSCGQYAGSIKQRLEDLQAAMDAKDVKAIFCSRGGYGTIHLIEKLDFTLFKKYPKWLIGFSDITVLHNLYQKENFASLHSLMARHLTIEPENDPCSLHLKNILEGNLPQYSCSPHKLNKEGKASGTLRGGNLSVFYGLRGTSYDIPPKNSILYIEDVSERPHAIERMMYNLKLGGVLKELSGLIIGQFTEYEEDNSLGKKLYEALADLVQEYNYPICFNFPVGHTTQNLPLINGAQVELIVNKKSVELKFKPNTPKE
ncbi:LD-carboxypeptidase [uncultured Bacteroides sp.]|uniref:S66 peptidase family protein n=1 Tax=uncultured Bacteroides sp. TaxID=162156 RepID=UPI002AAA65AE|nr:LD-carboxypeptidase [uncultured Bacteroides sp.]